MPLLRDWMFNLKARAGAALDALRSLPFPRGNHWGDWTATSRTRRNWKREAGDPTENSAVMACIRWVCRVWPEAPVRVYQLKGNKREIVPDHPLTNLLNNPNPFYGAGVLWKGTVLSLNLDGNAYWYILRNTYGEPVQLLYLPHHLVEPVVEPGAPSDTWISYYRYTPEGREVKLLPEDVIHFRDGLDPQNMRKGLSPLKALFLEIFTDNETALYVSTMMANMGMPGVTITPDPSGMNPQQRVAFDEPRAKEIEARFQRKFTGDLRGSVLVSGIPMKVQTFAFSPKDMTVRELRRIPEERISAVLGIPAVVAGLGAGLDRSTYNNSQEARREAYEGNVIPTQTLVADELELRLLPEWTDDPAYEVDFDHTRVRVLQDDEEKKARRWVQLYVGGIARRSEGRAAMGMETDPADEVFRHELQAPLALPPGTDPKDPKTGDKKRRPFTRTRSGTLTRKEIQPQDNALWDAAERFRKALLAREKTAVAEMSTAYEGAAKAIQEDLDALTERMEAALEKGETIGEGWLLQERRYRALIDQVEEALTELADAQAPKLTEHQQAYVELADEHAEKLTRAAVGPKPEAAGVDIVWNRLPKSTLESLVGFASDGSPLRELLNELGPDASERIRQSLFDGVAAGHNPRKIAKQIRTDLNGNRARAEAIARTETIRAAREATRQSFIENDDVVTGWTWVASLSTETCACCWAMHGTEHSGDEVLDDHVNGRCVMVPKTKSWAEITGDDSIPDTRPVIEDGPTAFSRLTEAEQREILGTGLFELYSGGTVGLESMVVQTHDARWGTMRRVATQEEAIAAAGG